MVSSAFKTNVALDINMIILLNYLLKGIMTRHPVVLINLKCQKIESELLAHCKEGDVQLQNEEFGHKSDDKTEPLMQQHRVC